MHSDHESLEKVSEVLNFRPILSRAKAVLRKPRSLFEAAVEVCELEPGSTFEIPPALSLPGEFARVTGFIGDPELHKACIRGGTRNEGPTLGYRFKNALVADFTVYGGDTYQVYRSGKKRPVLSDAEDCFEEAQLCTTTCAETYFGHFFHDALPLEELAARRNVTPLAFTRTPWLHEQGYRQLFEREVVRTSSARVRDLWVVDERTLNEGWISRFDALRGRLRQKAATGKDDRVFLMRGALASARSLHNEGQIAEALTKVGFSIVEPEREEAATLAGILAGAKLAVCVAGSAKLHALVAMAKGTTLIDIHLSSGFGSIGKLLSDSAGIRWGYVIAEPANGGFHLDPDRLMRTLDLVR